MHTFPTMIIEESVCFMLCEPFFFGAIILMWYTRNTFLLASDIFFINWTVRMSDNLPERVQILGHVHIICITVWENRIICSQIFCDLLLKSAFEQIFNVMQLILVKIKWHIKWKYLIQKFRDICLSYNYIFMGYWCTIKIFCYFISQRDTNSEILHIWKICGVLFFHPIFMYFFPFEIIAWGASASGNMSLYFLYHLWFLRETWVIGVNKNWILKFELFYFSSNFNAIFLAKI
jgi:hypothetical protein